MASFDYTELLAIAQELIEEYGRAVTLTGQAKAPATASKPWEGPSTIASTPLALFGCFVPPNTVREFGLTALGLGTEFKDLITFSQQIMICSPGSTDISDYTNLVDGGVTWGIIGQQVLKPGPTVVLAFIGVRR